METEKTILLVEDQAVIALAEKKTLESHGFKVLTAATGEKALEKVRSVPEIDLVLMDIDLGPGMDGTEAAVRILAERDLPLIFLSSHSEKKIVDKTEGITSYGYIVKDSGEMVLGASIRMAFRLFEARREARQTGRKLRALINAVPDLMFVVDEEGRPVDFPEAEDAGTGFLPGDLDRFPQYCRSCIRTGETRSLIHTGNGDENGRSFDIRIAKIDKGHALVIVRDVTEKHATELRMKKITQAIRQSPSTVVITDSEGNIEYVNPKFTELTGYLPEEVLGANPRILKSGLTPDAVYRDLWDTVTAGREWRGSFRNRKKNGEIYCESASIAPVRDRENRIVSYIAVKEDITELQESKEALLEKGAFLRVLFDRARDNIMIHEVLEDGQPGNFIDVNDSTCRTLGYTREELMQMSPLDTTASGNGDFVRSMLRDILRKGSVLFEAEGKTKDGRLIPFELQVSHLKVGEKNLVIAISREISEKKKG